MSAGQRLGLACALTFAGCDPGGETSFHRPSSTDSPTPTPTITLEVLSVAPVAGASDVALDQSISVVFDRDLSPSTVTSATFQVLCEEEEVPGMLAVVGSTATFTTDRLQYLADHDVLLTQEIESYDGAMLPLEYGWSFRTRDLIWTPPAPLESGSGNAQNPKIAASSSGAIATWIQADGADENVYAAMFDEGAGWSSPQIIESLSGDASATPHLKVATNDAGHAIVVWAQPANDLWATRYVPGAGWGAPQLIDSQSGILFSINDELSVALDSAGNAIATWSQTDGTRYNIWANRYDAGSGWTTAQLLETDNAGGAYVPRVAVAPDGSAAAIWTQSDGTRESVFAALFLPGFGWSSPSALEFSTANAYSAAIVGDNERFVAAWAQSDGIAVNTYSSVYMSGTGWTAPQIIEQVAGDAGGVRLGMAAGGVVVGCWYHEAAGQYSVYANRFTPGSGWGTAVPLETAADPPTACEIAADASGQVLLGWSRFDSSTKLRRARYLPDTGWSAVGIFENSGGSGGVLDLAALADGRALLVWTSNNSILESRLE